MAEDDINQALARERERGRRREMDEAQRRGEEKARQESINKEHSDDIRHLQSVTAAMKKEIEEVKGGLIKVEKSFGEFAAVAKALAENGVTNKTFIVSVALLLVAIIGLFLGVAHH